MSRHEETPFVAAADTDLLHRLVEVNPGYLWATDTDLRFTALFGRRLRQDGVTPEDALGQTVAEYGGVPPIVGESHRRALAGESVFYDFELNGIIWRARIDPLEGPDGTIVGVAGAALDVTSLVHAEHELTESRAKLDLALTQLPAIFWATDTKLRLTSAAGLPLRGAGRDVDRQATDGVARLGRPSGCPRP